MEFGFTQEQQMLRESVRRFMKKECTREYIRACSDNDRFPSELYEKMAAQGWMGIPFPEKYGGAGLGPMELAIFLEEAGYGWYGAGTSYFSTVVLGAYNIMTYGTEAQKDEFLPKVISGETRLAFALSEPNVGSDAAAVELFAEERGDHFVLNGQKMFTTNAHVAHQIVTVTRTIRNPEKKHDGITIFLVDADAPGIEIRPLKQMGRSATHTNEVFFRDVRVPRSRMMGKLHEGWANLNSGLGIERLSVAMMYSGTSQAMIDYVAAYAKERRQFGQPISKFQAVQHKLADMQTKAEIARLLGYRVAWMLEQGLPCFKEMSMAKLWASEAMFDIANNGVQIMGGYGVLKEYDMELFFRDSRIGMIGAGASEIQRTIIAKQMGL
ncbi:acyl-CoA/acyl-ACP dehydrogenase [Diaphorobacter ruginosibacter]|uniref:Acyl-CoA/acyl-ACP dehydrogenase n=1 Tax=Diaphorobacter ruginosibacter TaxID=1715720 RepID=A0A7G9RJP0_9BURK|nr:acyl-CoA dehydrogenase family protein [Diaphorobacter ruginosibacter]QNN55815.1 acyl-CoA/acyl-ACP dehydrogenase [Diaphorobacter ruginosibacter]